MPGSKARGTARVQRARRGAHRSWMRPCAEQRCRRKGGDMQLLQQRRALSDCSGVRVPAPHLGSACLGLMPSRLRAQPQPAHGEQGAACALAQMTSAPAWPAQRRTAARRARAARAPAGTRRRRATAASAWPALRTARPNAARRAPPRRRAAAPRAGPSRPARGGTPAASSAALRLLRQGLRAGGLPASHPLPFPSPLPSPRGKRLSTIGRRPQGR